jgi:hypothetical protein
MSAGYGLPARGAKALTANDTEGPMGHLFAVKCTVAGDVSLTLQDGSTHVIGVVVGYSTFPYCVRKVNSSGTTATATYANMV